MTNENLQDMNLWHVSKSKITSLRKTPMFFALEKSHSIGWYKSALNDGADTAYMYKATLKPSTVIVTYKELKQMLSLPNDNDYIEMLISNPSSSEILSNKITKAAIKNGIDGITYLDYDPRDFSRDLEAVILFNPKKSLSSIEEEPIKSSNRKASNEPNNSVVNTLKKVVDIFKKKYKNIEADYDSGYMGKQAFRMYINNFINGKELQVAYQYKNHILSVFIPGVLGTKELEIDLENMSPANIVNKINTIVDVNEDFLKRILRLEKLTLEYRIRKLESLLLEGKRDQEILNSFLGDEYYNKYQEIKNKIKDPEYKDIYKIIKMDPDEVKDYIDNFQSNTDIRRSNKQGATKLYEDDEWIVYRITTYHAAQLYGKNTRWCITGRYEGHEERGEEYFYNYIKNNKLDGGYYFYINKKDPYTKYCILQKENGRIHSIWDAGDTNMGKSSVDLPTDLPEVEGVNLKRAKTKKDLLIRAINHDDDEAIKELINKGLSPNTVVKKSSALAFAIENDKVHAVKALLECGADADETSAGDWTLIDNACRKADRKVANDIVRLLISHSNNISDRTFNTVCRYCDYLTVKTLLDCGYTPNNESIDSATRFISSETARTVELLLNAGANPNERNKFGTTILSRLMVWTNKEAQAVIKVLRDHGAVE